MGPRVDALGPSDAAPPPSGGAGEWGMSAAVKHTLSVLVENKPGVLSRVAGLFTRRGLQHRLPGREPDRGSRPLAHDDHG